jgi:hypothetical protein
LVAVTSTVRLRALLGRWPWFASVVAASAVDLVIGAARAFDFSGIEGFSTTNYGWLALGLVGGTGLGWRLAQQPGGWRASLRAMAAGALTFVIVFLAVTATALVFLPEQPLQETVTTDAPGRAAWVALAVAVFSGAFELLHACVRRAQQLRRR